MALTTSTYMLSSTSLYFYRCCDNAAVVTKHAIVDIFNGSRIHRAPRKDLFHAINGVLKTTHGTNNARSSELGATRTPCRRPHHPIPLAAPLSCGAHSYTYRH